MQLRTYAVKHYSEETKTVTVEEIYYFPHEQETYYIINETYKNLLQNPELTIIASDGRLLKPAHKKKINLSLPAKPSKMLSLLSKFHLISSSNQDMIQWKKEKQKRKYSNSSRDFHRILVFLSQKSPILNIRKEIFYVRYEKRLDESYKIQGTKFINWRFDYGCDTCLLYCFRNL